MKHRNTLVCTDALEGLRKLPDASVDCIVTSPPYWSLRDYGVDGQLGLEPSIEEYLEKLIAVFDEARRVLTPTGTCWVNFGDCYSDGNRIRPVGGDEDPRSHTVRRRSLCLVPERFAMAMLEHGWILRNKIVWRKPNALPHSVKNRMTNQWEYLFLFTQSEKYDFDLDAIRVPHKAQSFQRTGRMKPGGRSFSAAMRAAMPGGRIRLRQSLHDPRNAERLLHPAGKNPGDVWEIPASSYRGAHFAVYPERLVERPILTTPRWICTKCGMARKRITESRKTQAVNNTSPVARRGKESDRHIHQYPVRYESVHVTTGWTDCGCNAGFRRALVLDPFIGSGTTAAVAKRLGRDYLGFDLNPEYLKLARERIDAVALESAASGGPDD